MHSGMCRYLRLFKLGFAKHGQAESHHTGPKSTLQHAGVLSAYATSTALGNNIASTTGQAKMLLFPHDSGQLIPTSYNQNESTIISTQQCPTHSLPIMQTPKNPALRVPPLNFC